MLFELLVQAKKHTFFASNKESMKTIEKDNTLKTEFIVEGKIDTIYKVVEEAVATNHFNLVPFRVTENSSKKKSFQVMSVDRKTQRKYSCGAIELIKQKESDQVLFRLDSTKGTPNVYNQNGDVPLERVFFIILQQLIQRGIKFTRASKKDQIY